VVAVGYLLDMTNPRALLWVVFGLMACMLLLSFAVAEAPSEGALERVIRVLVHCYAEEGNAPRHAYLNGAEALRPDRAVRPGKRRG